MQKTYTIKEIAAEMDLCEDTVRRLFRINKIEGIRNTVGIKRYVLVYTQSEYDTIKNAYNNQEEITKNYLTSSQIAEMAGCSNSWVSYIANKHNIEHILMSNKRSVASFFTKDAAEKLIELINQRKLEKEEKAKNKKVVNDLVDDAEAALHPLVTDKRFLNLNYWPDVIPDCFKECEECIS